MSSSPHAVENGPRNSRAGGGLLSYGLDPAYLYRRAADYINRILHGAHPSELPVQESTAFELVINLKAAKTIGLAIPPAILAQADEVTE